ncbi:TPA: D-alanyl-D-alanine carboxypeptidase/D-alanyl-D-alanine-endopeptidase [Klebsiella pneumoniae]|nr:D-alanyl-D-alanine carboxypeptidase/D-alanyl-D-alanine-endopeptidase [Klebsiella pneumoniae]
MRFPRFIIGLTAGIALSAQAANIDEYINQLPAGANLAFMAQKVGASTPEIDYHSQQMALPASTQKVITALAALLQLGPDFRFTTTLETKGSLDGGVLKGDLIARFGGDPTLKRQDIRNMVATLKKAGVQRIEGNVLIDTSVFAIQDGASYAGAILKAELAQAGITYSGTLLRQTLANEPGTVLATSQSAPLHDLLRIMLKKSDNMIADTVFRTIGHARFGVPGTWRAGSDAVRQILRQQAGVDLGNTIIADGSGLSRHNLIAPATMMQVLQYIAQHDTELNFISMLPLAGHDGSLQYRAGLHQAGVDGKVSAKTGSLQGVYNLAGFITTASGQKMAFVQYLSGYAVEPADQRNRRIPLVRFESRLYKDLYQNN